MGMEDERSELTAQEKADFSLNPRIAYIDYFMLFRD